MKSVSVCIQVLFFCWWLSGDGGVPGPPEAHTVSGLLAKTVLTSLQFWPCFISVCVCVRACVHVVSVCSQHFSLSCLCRTSLPAMTTVWFRCCTGLCSSSTTTAEPWPKWRPASMWWGTVFIFIPFFLKTFYFPFNHTLLSFPIPH